MKVKNKNSLYFNFYSGVSGDMLIGSLIDLGIELSVLKEILGKIDDRVSFKVKNVKRGVNNCTLIKPEFPKELNKNFNWNQLKDFGNFFKDEKFVYQNFNETIKLLKKSEENVHNEVNAKPHELGNFDTVFDIVCFYKSLEYLGIEKLYHSGIPFSQGEIEIDHGTVSSLAPVTLELIKNLSIPIYTTKKNPNFEMCTPTGISLLKNFNQSGVAEGVINRIGYGAGTKDFKGSSNSVSVNLLSLNSDLELLNIIETNIDDMSPEFIPFVIEKILELGANDVWAQNILMKKGRPAYKVSVLCEKKLNDKINDLFKKETSTFGVRISEVKREAFDRRIETVHTKYGEINLKLKLDSGEIIGAYPEYEDCKNLSKVHNIPLKVIFDEALNQFNNLPR
jgi:uncharacterized protein (TIGR00299 family) protein